MTSKAEYFERLSLVLKSNRDSITHGIDVLSGRILEVSGRRSNVWIIGNGGSASTAEHLETDLSFIRYNIDSKAPIVNSLTANSALLTAISNDIDYASVFSTILKKKSSQGDLLISISASGNSENILQAIVFARKHGLTTFSLLGFDGGQAKDLSDDSIVVMTEKGEYGIVEDLHLMICHAVSETILKRVQT